MGKNKCSVVKRDINSSSFHHSFKYPKIFHKVKRSNKNRIIYKESNHTSANNLKNNQVSNELKEINVINNVSSSYITNINKVISNCKLILNENHVKKIENNDQSYDVLYQEEKYFISYYLISINILFLFYFVSLKAFIKE